MAKKYIKINIPLPAGVLATTQLTDLATQAAEAAIKSTVSALAKAQKIANDLAAKGVDISAEEIMDRTFELANAQSEKKATRKATAKGKKASTQKKASASGKRKRIVLDDEQRQALIDEMASGGLKVAQAAAKYGISTATVMNIKTAAGLTKKRAS